MCAIIPGFSSFKRKLVDRYHLNFPKETVLVTILLHALVCSCISGVCILRLSATDNKNLSWVLREKRSLLNGFINSVIVRADKGSRLSLKDPCLAPH